ncbi:hypothetical protein COV82_00910 [Candidatus Peregrinibacteria bacterium CG11_big_fil_rev_8_21_14_0_20_46_8]|nr:MAG: hypothetical protein COV82_00910 [Candidatus Peregrinibacteria bacterium CG11_big_fil_rev_8_21_14_0_20_46_8]
MQHNRTPSKYLTSITDELNELCKEHEIPATIESRLKSETSTAQKIARKKILPQHVMDTIGIRIIVEDIYACYNLLELIINKFKIIPERIKDYIQFPKENGYQSLHLVFQTGNQTIELQIRTWLMHQHAEKGLASQYPQESKEQEIVIEPSERFRLRPNPEAMMSYYAHLGGINRQLAIISNLVQSQKATKKKRDIAQFIVRSALELTRSKSGALLKYDMLQDRFILSTSFGIRNAHQTHLRKISENNDEFIEQICTEKKRLWAHFDRTTGQFTMGKREEHQEQALCIPLVHDMMVLGIIIIFFDTENLATTLELNLLELFAWLSTYRMVELKILKPS